VRGQVALHATVRQHRSNGALRPSDSPPLPIQCNEGNQHVAVNGSAARINNDAAIGIAIERDAEVGAVRAHLLAECGGVGGANAIIDHTVTHRKWQDRGASGGECCSGEWRGGAMCRINHHTQRAGTHCVGKIGQRSFVSLSIRLSFSCM
jgi:hypothetical protein